MQNVNYPEGRPSSFGKLLQLGLNAKGVGSRTEDFTTEALALTIRQEPAPMNHLLADILKLDRFVNDRRRLVALTQQRVSPKEGQRTAILDLVLAPDGESDEALEVWVEIKAGSPISQQLHTYRHAIEAAKGSGVERHLMVLGIGSEDELPRDLRDIPFASWQRLHDTIRPGDGLAWREFASFLRERHLAKWPKTPPNQVELLAEMLDPALRESERDLRVGWRKAPRVSTLRTQIKRRLQETGSPSVRLWTRSWNVRVDIGLFGDPDKPELGVQLGITWWYPLPRGTLARLVRAAQREGRLRGTWRLVDRPEVRSAIVEIGAPLVGISDPGEQILAWLRELDRAGLLVNIDEDGMVVEDPPDRLRFADSFSSG